MSQFEPKKNKISNISHFDKRDFCEGVRELDASKAPDEISSYVVRVLKKNFVVFFVETYLRMTHTKNDFCGNFRTLEE